MKKWNHLFPLFLLTFFLELPAMATEKNMDKTNPRLINSPSAYLRSAAHQPIEWYPWGEEAFQKAQKEDKPILLDIGAVWCHWCHVMDQESYENPEVAKIIQKYFIPIKVDRDERPDVDQRYQEAVAAISGQGGWPLTAFLTPQGEAFYGGTFFPAEDRSGMPGMKNLLPKIAELYQKKKESLEKDAKELTLSLSSFQEGRDQSGEISAELIDTILQNMSRSLDAKYGGFGRNPKFPDSGALEFLLEESIQKGDSKILDFFKMTLEAMSRGGIHDQLGGAFHRYSVDREWKVPHFEVMLDVNAGLLENFAHAYQVTQEKFFKETTTRLFQFIQEEFSDQEKGGFYASQDADTLGDEDGHYYRWTVSEIKSVLDLLTFRVMERYWGLEDSGKNQKNILSLAKDASEIAQSMKLELKEVEALIENGKALLKASRDHRGKPSIDKNIYINWNAMMVCAYFEVFKALGFEEGKTFALKTVDFLWDHAYIPGEGMSHSIHDGKPWVKNVLDDQAQMAHACWQAYEMTGDVKYRDHVIELIHFCIEKFWDSKGGFFDTIPEKESLGLLKHQHKSFEDNPTPAANPILAMVLDHLYWLTGNKLYREKAEETLKAFAPSAEKGGTEVATYVRALAFHLEDPVKVAVVGKKEEPSFRFLVWAAHQVYRPHKMVLPMGKEAGSDSVLSEDLRMQIRSQENAEEAVAFLCASRSCAPPTDQVEELKKTIKTFGLKLQTRDQRPKNRDQRLETRDLKGS
ncbi:MAG: thioredoxin domain-containing protein [Chlamydiae bacterium]|nr:thioredoxin domain-containing protein [Chlamydiota bacterium]MBI3277236.1 thioredoxin domain-containing protein [Chlamydiota bacterium]